MRVSVRRIQEVVAAHYGLPVDVMVSPSKARNHTGPRQQAIYLALRLTGLSTPKVGQLFGGRDHTTIIHARRTISRLLEITPKLVQLLNRLGERARQSQSSARGSWSDTEIDLLQAIYPKCGSKAVCRALPHRTMQSVWAKAGKLGLAYEKTANPTVNFPRECKQCSRPLHYSRSAKYLHRGPTGLCRPCRNRQPRSEEERRRHRDGCLRAAQNADYRARQREAVRVAMAKITPEERERRRERGRICGLSNRGNQSNPAGSPCRILAGQRSAETKRQAREAARLAEVRRPRTFEEKLQAVLEGRATVSQRIVVSNDPVFTLGGVSSGWAA